MDRTDERYILAIIGVNAVPANVVELGRENPVAMFDGPQPAMLPILSGQTHRHYGKLTASTFEEIAVTGTPVFVEDKDPINSAPPSTATASAPANSGCYQTLRLHGSGLALLPASAPPKPTGRPCFQPRPDADHDHGVLVRNQ